jgi:hypothetical protein
MLQHISRHIRNTSAAATFMHASLLLLCQLPSSQASTTCGCTLKSVIS